MAQDLIRRALSLAAAVVWALSVPMSARQADSREILSAVLKDVYTPTLPSLLVVQAEPLGTNPISHRGTYWDARLTELPPELRTRLESRIPAPAEAFREELFPRGTRLVPGSQINGLFERRDAGEDPWGRFAQQFPESRGWIALSEPVVSQDGHDAVVYYDRHCGGLCGAGAYVWLQRDAENGWRVRKRIVTWVS